MGGAISLPPPLLPKGDETAADSENGAATARYDKRDPNNDWSEEFGEETLFAAAAPLPTTAVAVALLLLVCCVLIAAATGRSHFHSDSSSS